MNSTRWLLVLGLALGLAPTPRLQAQQGQGREPRIGYVLPAGGQQGTTFMVTVGGQNLDLVNGAYLTGAGYQAKVVDRYKPLLPGAANRLRDNLKELLERKRAATAPPGKLAPGTPGTAGPPATQPTTRPSWTAADDQLVAEIQKKLMNFAVKPSSPAIAETVTFEVALVRDAAPGRRELRLVLPNKVTNPLPFHVGQFPERTQEPGRQRVEPKQSVPAENVTVTLPVVANGQIMPGGVDRYHFAARKGQNLVVAVAARALVPYIADAVPGWFQATVTLRDAKGTELAYSDDFRFSPDPLLQCRIPADGQYTVEIHDAIYRGREDFVYRMTIAEVPVVTSVFPLGGKAGGTIPLEVEGWRLPLSRLTFDATNKAPGLYPLTLPDSRILPGLALLAVDDLPESTEREPNDQPAQAELITGPAIVNGRIGRAGDLDVYQLTGKAGEAVVAEVMARRLGSPLDSLLILTDSAGRQIAANDDQEDPGAGLTTHHADSLLKATLPADGTYYLQIRGTEARGGPEYGYRLRVGPPRPDFELRVTPSSLALRRGSSDTLTVHVLRRDGFAGEVALSLAGAPAAWGLSAKSIPADKDKITLTVKAPTPPPAASGGMLSLNLQGRAKIQGREVTHRAVPAENMMQAFAYWHLVSAEELVVVAPGARWSLGARLDALKPPPPPPGRVPAAPAPAAPGKQPAKAPGKAGK